MKVARGMGALTIKEDGVRVAKDVRVIQQVTREAHGGGKAGAKGGHGGRSAPRSERARYKCGVKGHIGTICPKSANEVNGGQWGAEQPRPFGQLQPGCYAVEPPKAVNEQMRNRDGERIKRSDRRRAR